MQIIIYTDGGARGNPGPGAYAAVMKYGNHRKELSQGFRKTTNNRMELLAVTKALQALKKDNLQVTVYTDSQYVQKAVTEGWVFNWEKKGFKDKKNPDLWREFLKVYRKHQVSLYWVKGHAGIEENERCDELVKEAFSGPNLLVDHGYENPSG